MSDEIQQMNERVQAWLRENTGDEFWWKPKRCPSDTCYMTSNDAPTRCTICGAVVKLTKQWDSIARAHKIIPHDIPCPPWTAEHMERALMTMRLRLIPVPDLQTNGWKWAAGPRETDPIPRYAVLKALDALREKEQSK